MVGSQDGFSVVLHHQHGIAQVPQFLKRVQQADIVSLVQADGRFVQDIDHSHQAGADLGGQTDALALASGKAGRRPVQGQVIQAHVTQEFEAFPNFLNYPAADLHLAAGKLKRFKKVPCLGHGKSGHPVDVQSTYPDGQTLLAQPGAAAFGTIPKTHVFLGLFPRMSRFGVQMASFELGDDPLEGAAIKMAAVFPLEKESDLFIPRTV